MHIRLVRHLTNDEDGRALQLKVMGTLLHRGERAAAFTLLGERGVFNHGHGHVATHAAGQQTFADVCQLSHAHVHHQGGPALGQGCQFRLLSS